MLNHHKCIVTRAGQILAHDIDVWVEVIREPSGMRSWHGQLAPPRDSGITVATVGENYRVHLDDGGEGEFLVTRHSFGTHDANHVEFQGTEPLEKPNQN
jgi:hypothetical protein